MKVRRIHRPTEDYAQCQFPKEELRDQPWRGYREKRSTYNGKDASTCMREAQWEVDGKKLCTQHAGIRVLGAYGGRESVKIVRWAAAWCLYWAGDLASKMVADWQPEWLGERIADAYQALMRWSSSVQGDGRGPWS